MRRPAARALVPVLAAAGALAPAATASAATTIDASAGVNGYADPQGQAVVSVRVTADELVDGEIRITRRDSGLVVRQDVQVPAGTTKDVLLVVPGPFFDGTLKVDVLDGDRAVATQNVQVRSGNDVELVGVLPRLLARGDELPDQVTLDSGTGRAELAALPLDVVDLGPSALSSYDTIAGTSDDLAAIDQEQRQTLLLWVNHGGRLLLDDATTVDALPAAWRPGPAGYAWAGVGEVRVVGGAASRGEWSAIVEPSAVDDEAFRSMELFVDPEQDLARRAGLRLPSLTPIIITLAVYGFVVGPVVYLVLRRARRLTLGWIVIPLVAVLTAGGVVAAGGRYRSAGNPATSSFVDLSPAGGMALTSVLAVQRGGGTTTVTAPGGWTIDASAAVFRGLTMDPRAITDGPAGAVLSMQLEPGQVATETLRGPVDAEPLAVTAALRPDGTVGGTVTNDTASTLRDVAVFVGSGAVRVGDLAAGSSAAWSTRAPVAIERFVSRADQVWMMPFEVGAETQAAELGIWGTASVAFDLFPTGLARAVGWADGLDTGVRFDRAASARSALSVTTPVDAAGQPLGAATVRSSIVRTPFTQFGDATDELVYRYLLPPGATAEGVRLDDVDQAAIVTLETWDGTAWTELDTDADHSSPAVPAAAIRGGTLLVRATLNLGAEPGSIPVLEAAA